MRRQRLGGGRRQILAGALHGCARALRQLRPTSRCGPCRSPRRARTRRRSAATSDRPVSPSRPARKLAIDDIERPAGFALVERLADADDRPQAGRHRRANLAVHDDVGLGEEAAALGVADDDPGAGVLDHRGADFARKRAFALGFETDSGPPPPIRRRAAAGRHGGDRRERRRERRPRRRGASRDRARRGRA